MDQFRDDHLSDELAEIDDLLRRERPQPAAVDLDRMRAKTAMRLNKRASSTPLKGTFMKSRIAITMILVMGVLMSGTGATLALSGSSTEGSASRAQYCPPASQNGQGGQNSNSQNTNGRRCGQQGVGGESANSETLGGGSGSEDGSGTGGSANRQAASDDGGNLPFTGFAALPIMLIGVALLGSGLVLTRRVRGSQAL